MATFNLSAIQSKLNNPNIRIIGHREHRKAVEEYIDVEFIYPSKGFSWHGSVPIRDRRIGVDAQSDAEVVEIIASDYIQMNPDNIPAWNKAQTEFWDSMKADVTRGIFDATRKHFKWTCVKHELSSNPNWAKRWQTIKEFGYATSTHTNMYCAHCSENTTHILMLYLPRAAETGYETISQKLKLRIQEALGFRDAYENRKDKNLIPDHKFPEARWGTDTRSENPENMSEGQIREKFQLLNNQRNLQKREACRNCVLTGKRGTPLGITFYYKGDANWPQKIPKSGKAAEQGCVGCDSTLDLL